MFAITRRSNTRSRKRLAEHRNPADGSIAREWLRTAYDCLEANLDQSPWAIGEQFTLADCAAARPFYADWVEEIDDRDPQLKAYRARLLAHPVGRPGGRRSPGVSTPLSAWRSRPRLR
ncbi:MAG: glutathione binding-like protein [Microvirga sp.]